VAVNSVKYACSHGLLLHGYLDRSDCNTSVRHLQDTTHVSRLVLGVYTPCLRKNCAKLFLSELCEMFINFNNFWHVDAKMAKIICYVKNFHLTSLLSSQYLVKEKNSNFYLKLKIITY